MSGAPTPLAAAIADLEVWFQWETDGYWPILEDALRRSQVVGPMIHDARIAALCAGNGVGELLSADRDFSRFAGLPTRNPLIEAAR